MRKEETLLNNYIKKNGLKQSSRRKDVLFSFLKTEKHLTAEELYDIVKKESPGTGRATVYRTMKILCDCGLAQEVNFADGITRYEHRFLHKHHDHMVCNYCARAFEVIDRKIDSLIDSMAKSKGFKPEYHDMTVYGICSQCRAK